MLRLQTLARNTFKQFRAETFVAMMQLLGVACNQNPLQNKIFI